MLALPWSSRKRETPDCGVRPNALRVEAEGMANAPPGRRALSKATETGLMLAAVSPKVPAKPAAVRLLSVRPTGIMGNVRLFRNDAPLRSRVP